MSKFDQGYEHFASGRMSEDMWTQKSRDWETELQTVEAELGRAKQPRPFGTAAAVRISELAK